MQIPLAGPFYRLAAHFRDTNREVHKSFDGRSYNTLVLYCLVQ